MVFNILTNYYANKFKVLINNTFLLLNNIIYLSILLHRKDLKITLKSSVFFKFLKITYKCILGMCYVTYMYNLEQIIHGFKLSIIFHFYVNLEVLRRFKNLVQVYKKTLFSTLSMLKNKQRLYYKK